MSKAQGQVEKSGKGSERSKKRTEDQVFYLILAVIFLVMVVSGLAAAGVL
jgi:predicted nucleic acid-binding Zn ribbon protein